MSISLAELTNTVKTVESVYIGRKAMKDRIESEILDYDNICI